MIGGIYSDQKCPLCCSKLKDDGKKSLKCPCHQEIKATQFSVRFKTVHQRFDSYEEADQFLDFLRQLYRRGKFDAREYKKENPLGFANLSERWLDIKKMEIKPRSLNAIKNHMKRASLFFGNENVKDIGYINLEDFLFSQHVKDKTRANIRSTLHSFWTWLLKRHYVMSEHMPEFPEIRFELGYRNTVSKEVQWQILDELKRITAHNPKIFLGIKWLCTYISIRPGEMLQVREGDIDTGGGYMIIPHPKEKKPKVIPLIEEDVEIIKSMHDPKVDTRLLPFFRHPSGIKGTPANHPFSKNILYGWWKRSCKNLGIGDVDLYGGTRHSSARALRDHFSPEQIKQATMHSTNKAFERYFRIESEDIRKVYRFTSGKVLVKNFTSSQQANLL